MMILMVMLLKMIILYVADDDIGNAHFYNADTDGDVKDDIDDDIGNDDAYNADADGDAVDDDIGNADLYNADLYNADADTKLHLRVDAQSTFLPHSQPQNQIIFDDHDEYGEFDQSL